MKKLILEFKTLPAAIRTNKYSLFQAIAMALLVGAAAATFVMQFTPIYK